MLSDFTFTFQPDEDQEEFDHFTDEEEFEVFRYSLVMSHR